MRLNQAGLGESGGEISRLSWQHKGPKQYDQVEDVEQLVSARFSLPPPHPEVAAVVDQHLTGSEEAVEVDLLRRKSEEEPRAPINNSVVAEDEDPSHWRSHKTGDRADQRRLPGSVRAK